MADLTKNNGLKLAYRFSDGKGPVLVFLPGYMSDMAGGKATALFDWAVAEGRACLLMDYSGCGQSEGVFADGCLSIWRDEVWLLVDHVAKSRRIMLIGSSMGGWLMLLTALARPQQVAGLIGIAAAPDFTDWGYDNDQKTEIAANGVVYEENHYGYDPTPTYKKFWNDGQANLLLEKPIGLTVPLRLLHGQQDKDVPWRQSLKLAAQYQGDDVELTFIKSGDHRLSRDEDIDCLIQIISRLARQIRM